MDSSPDLSIKLRRGSTGSRDSFYMGFKQGIDSDIEEVTAKEGNADESTSSMPPPPPPISPPPPTTSDVPDAELQQSQVTDIPPPECQENYPSPDEIVDVEEQLLREIASISPPPKHDDIVLAAEDLVDEILEQAAASSGSWRDENERDGEEDERRIEEVDEMIENIQPPPPNIIDDDDDEKTNTSVTVILSKNKPPTSSSSSISSTVQELGIEDDSKSFPTPPPPLVGDSPKSAASISSRQTSIEVEITSLSPVSQRSPPSKKSSSSKRSVRSVQMKKSPSPPQRMASPRSPPKKLIIKETVTPLRQPPSNIDSDSADSFNAMDYKIDDDNRDDSSPTDSMPHHPTPPPLAPLLLEKSRIMEAANQVLVPSPSSPDNAIISPETLSRSSSASKSPKTIHYAQHVTIDETKFPSSLRSSHQQLVQQMSHRSTSSSSSPPPPFNSGPHSPLPVVSVLSNNSLSRIDSSNAIVPRNSSELRFESQTTKSPASIGSAGGSTTTTQHLAVLYQTHHHLHPILTSPVRRPSRLPENSRFLHQQAITYGGYSEKREIKAAEVFCNTLSALYGKILVVMGIAFPMAEVISTFIPPSFYEVFYLYLYIGSMVFLLFMYITLMCGGSKPSSPLANAPAAARKTSQSAKKTTSSSTNDSGDDSDHDDTESSDERARIASRSIAMRRPSVMAAALKAHHYGSFYLRMGAVAFGIGSMIYSGLELGQYFELQEKDTSCHNVLLALTPATRMIFIFVQMYFIFLNNEQIRVYRHKILARFGLMHMIGTNLSVWFSVLIQETKHEILTFYDPENRTLKISHRIPGNKHVVSALEEVHNHTRVARGLKGPHNIFECRRSNILGNLVQDASPFLFPCTIEYSLICAAILYVMWRNLNRPELDDGTGETVRRELHPLKRSPHHYSVDCAGAHKGLFVGILMLVVTIIALIIFFVLIHKDEYTNFAVTEVNICELILYGSTILATLIGMIQVRKLHYDSARSFSLDDILLVGAQTGSFLYSTFTIIGAHLTLRPNTILILITAMASLFETAFQTMFILDASRRSAATPEHIRKKPGREIVTFLLVSNLAMWLINTLEKSRAESHPLQLTFYGVWAWTIITHVSMPLAIFYRFHSTVCLCDIWKRAWKMKPTYM